MVPTFFMSPSLRIEVYMSQAVFSFSIEIPVMPETISGV
jgi:hypothetical protein